MEYKERENEKTNDKKFWRGADLTDQELTDLDNKIIDLDRGFHNSNDIREIKEYLDINLIKVDDENKLVDWEEIFQNLAEKEEKTELHNLLQGLVIKVGGRLSRLRIEKLKKTG